MNKKLKDKINSHVKLSLLEDQIKKDCTTKKIKNQDVKASLFFKEESVLFGKVWFEQSYRLFDKSIKFKWDYNDGDLIRKNRKVCEVTGNAKSILSCERVSLNFLQTLSAISNSAYLYNKKVSKKRIQILYTRKTIPGWRYAIDLACQKHNCLPHRRDLQHQILVKENHLNCINDFSEYIKQCKKLKKSIIVEAKSINEAKKFSKIKGIKRVLLDNFKPGDIKRFLLGINNIEVEISGNINLKNINKYLINGVDYISIGSITKNIKATDMTLLIK